MSFCVWSSSITALVCKLCWSRVCMRKKNLRKYSWTYHWVLGSWGTDCRKSWISFFLWQYHSLCMLGLGIVAFLAIIQVIHNYGKFNSKFPLPSLNRECYCILWQCCCSCTMLTGLLANFSRQSGPVLVRTIHLPPAMLWVPSPLINRFSKCFGRYGRILWSSRKFFPAFLIFFIVSGV